MSFFSNLKKVLKPTGIKIKSALATSIENQDPLLIDLMEQLIIADIDQPTAKNLVTSVQKQLPKNKTIKTAEIITIATETLKQKIANDLNPYARSITDLFQTAKPNQPVIIVMVGVNGTGKTTSISKLASLAKAKSLNPLLVAADSFRAAGIEQLEYWAKKLKIDFFKKPSGTEPAAIAYAATQHALSNNNDVVLIDTAGRLHTNHNLMAELEKLCRILKKIDPTYPQHIIMTLDATVGQNAKEQLKLFQTNVQVNGLIVTKMDGTAKAGIILTLTQQFQLPIYALGVGEKPEDLDQFSATEFAESLLS